MHDAAAAQHLKERREAQRGRERWRQSWGQFSLSLAIVALIVWSWQGSEIDLERLAASGGRMLEFLGRMFPPDLCGAADRDRSRRPRRCASRCSAPAAASCSRFRSASLAAETLTPHWVHLPVKALLAMIRGVPLILVAMLMVSAVGLGPLPGVLAIAFHATGMLGEVLRRGDRGRRSARRSRRSTARARRSCRNCASARGRRWRRTSCATRCSASR